MSKYMCVLADLLPKVVRSGYSVGCIAKSRRKAIIIISNNVVPPTVFVLPCGITHGFTLMVYKQASAKAQENSNHAYCTNYFIMSLDNEHYIFGGNMSTQLTHQRAHNVLSMLCYGAEHVVP